MSDDLPTLFSSPDSCALAVDIALRWAGADYYLQVLQARQDCEPTFLAINPSGEVPSLMLKGQTVLTGTQALLLLVADSHPESDLAPSSSTPNERYRLEQLLTFMTCDVHEALGPFLSTDRDYLVRRQAAEITRATLAGAMQLLVQLDARMGAREFILSKRDAGEQGLNRAAA